MSYESEVLSDSPVAYYRMNESLSQFWQIEESTDQWQLEESTDLWRLETDGTGLIQDSSGNGNHATSAVGTAVYEQGSLLATESSAKSIDFTADDAFLIPDHTTLDVGDTLTLEAWCRFDDVTNHCTIFSKGLNGFQLKTRSSEFRFGKQGVVTIVTSPATLTTGTIYYVVVTKDGSDTRLYVNAVDVTEAGTADTIADTATSLYIGQAYDGTEFSDGRFSHLAVYDTALSPARVLAHYEAATEAATAEDPFPYLAGGYYG